MFCTNCGKNLPDGAAFCNECGSRCDQPATTETVVLSTAPEASVKQETVIVPLVSSERTEVSAPVVDMQTMMVPEVPEVPAAPAQDPLEKMFPQQPEKSNAGVIIGLVAAAVVLVTAIVTVILGMLNNWWREAPQVPDNTSATTTTASTPATEPTETEPPAEPEDEELTPEQQRDKLSRFDAAGLTLYLGKEFEEVERDEDFICYEAGSLEVNVGFGFMSEVDEQIDSSRKFAKYYEDLEKDNCDSILRNKQHGIYYIVAVDDDETTVCGFYVAKGYGWVVEITTEDFDTLGQTLIDYVTLGQVSQDFEPPAPEVEVQPQKFSFAGLELTLDSTMRDTDFDDYCVYENEEITVRVQLTALADVQGSTSKEYAQWYLDEYREDDWKQMFMETSDEKFYYVAMANEEGWVNLVGMYTYGDMAWIVSAETSEGEKHAQTLAEYITSGRIIPEEVPQVETQVQLELGELKLTLSGNYKESYRSDTHVMLSNGVLDVSISTGSYAGQTDAPQTAEEMARKDYDEARELWDNAEMATLNDVSYVALWENTADAVNVVQGYYLVDGTWWLICVETTGDEHLADMKRIATCGVAPEPKPTFQKGELASRQRITLEGQSTADYQGLQISFSPDWTLDPTWGDSGAYYGEGVTMAADKCALTDLGVSNALDLIWKVAEEQYDLWQHYEAGLAGGVPYLILWNDESPSYTVLGAYADGTDCWEIVLQFEGEDFVDQAIWYATAGVLSDGSATA